MTPFISRTLVLLVFFLTGGSLFHPAQAQLQKIEQTIFGMDCAPCAHAMEQSLGSMKGVEAVSVSLNDGLATIDLRKMNEVVYRDIRTAISNGGFAAKKARLKAQGTLHKNEDRWILKTPAGEKFVLKPGKRKGSGENGFQDFTSNRQVIVKGQIPASPKTEDARWPLRVQQVRPAT